MKHSHNIMWCIDNIASHQTLPPADNPEWETGTKTRNETKINVTGEGSTDVFVLTGWSQPLYDEKMLFKGMHSCVLLTLLACTGVTAHARAQFRKRSSNHNNSSIAKLCYSGYRVCGVCALQSSSLPSEALLHTGAVEQMGNQALIQKFCLEGGWWGGYP